MTTFVELVTTDDTWLPHRSGAPPHGYLDEDAFAFRGVVLRRGELAMHIARLLPIELQASGVHCLSLDEAIVNEWAAGRLTPRTQDDLRALFAAFGSAARPWAVVVDTSEAGRAESIDTDDAFATSDALLRSREAGVWVVLQSSSAAKGRSRHLGVKR